MLGLTSLLRKLRFSNRPAQNIAELADALPHILWTADAEGRVEYANAALSRYIGDPDWDIRTNVWSDVVHENDYEKCLAFWTRFLPDPQPFEYEYRLYHAATRAYRWHLARVVPVFNPRGRVKRWIGTSTDIHEQRLDLEIWNRAHKGLGETDEQKFRFLADTVPNMIWIAAPTGQMIFVNKAWIDYTGCDLEETARNHTLMHADDIRAIMPIWKDSLQKAEPYTIEYRLKRHDGQFRWMLARATPVVDKDGKIITWFGSVTDIHDLRLQSEELIRTAHALEMTQQAAQVATWEYDVQRDVMIRTPYFDKLYGTHPADQKLSIATVLGRVHPEDKRRVLRAFSDGEEPKEPEEVDTYRTEFRVVHDDGRVRWLSVLGRVMRDEAGEIILHRGATFDVTRLREMQAAQLQMKLDEEAALQSSRLKSEFLASMSHEIRTPINGVIGMTQLLMNTSLTSEQYNYADAVRRSGEALLTVINDILDFSKIEAGKLDIENVPFSLKEILEDARIIALPSALVKNLLLEFESRPGVPNFVVGDPGRLRQILTNLLSNAIKFTHQGSVKLVASLTDASAELATVQFQITDTGIGISPEAQRKIFQPFGQGDRSTTRSYGGTGLGLIICKQLLDLMGGEMGFESREREGTTFWFRLTFEKRPEQAPALAFGSLQAAGLKQNRGKRILVVDDVYFNQVIAVKYLENFGYNAQAVGNGQEALEALNQSDFDLILMDCQMPGMDGYETTARIRLSGATRNPQIPIVALTACAMKGDLERCLESGMNDYLAKPLRPESLENILEKWI